MKAKPGGFWDRGSAEVGSDGFHARGADASIVQSAGALVGPETIAGRGRHQQGSLF